MTTEVGDVAFSLESSEWVESIQKNHSQTWNGRVVSKRPENHKMIVSAHTFLGSPFVREAKNMKIVSHEVDVTIGSSTGSQGSEVPVEVDTHSGNVDGYVRAEVDDKGNYRASAGVTIHFD